jgi:3',5'-nucleoside bisphosphate phosphatase
VPELVDRCAAHKLAVISLTDHDTDEGVAQARELAEERGMEFISGIEISAAMPDREVHILGYGFQDGHPKMQRYRQRLRQAREERARKIVRRLQDLGVSISEEDVWDESGQGMVGRPHIARVLVGEGVVESEFDAFDLYLRDGAPAFVPKDVYRAADAIELIHSAGGLAVMAHPGQWTSEHDLRYLVDRGLDGLEVVHPSHQPYLTEYWMAVALRYGLLRTGGSDYHGSRPEDAAIDDYTIPRPWVEMLLGRIAEATIEN